MMRDDPHIRTLITGPNSDLFGDDKSIVGHMRRQLLREQMDPGSKYDKQQIAISLHTLEVLLDKLKEAADFIQ